DRARRTRLFRRTDVSRHVTRGRQRLANSQSLPDPSQHRHGLPDLWQHAQGRGCVPWLGYPSRTGLPRQRVRRAWGPGVLSIPRPHVLRTHSLGTHYSPRLSASFSTFWKTSDGLSPAREYWCLRLISASSASRSAWVAYQWNRCHSGPRSLRNGSPGGRLTRIP